MAPNISSRKGAFTRENQDVDISSNEDELFREANQPIKVETSADPKYTCFLGEFKTEQFYWGNFLYLLFIHFMLVYVVLTHDYVNRPGIYLFNLFVTAPISAFGITGGAHRYFTHRCYKAKLPLKLFLIFSVSLAGQNSILDWVKDHRVHHKFSETDADPHNAKRGFWFSHIGWLCMKKHPEVIRKGKQIDVSDITSDPIVAFHTRHFIWFKLLCCYIIPTAVPMYLLNESFMPAFLLNAFFRHPISLNCTWAVNSFAHLWGQRPFNKNIQPAENVFVSFASYGEGWHNYHHTFPWDYRAAEIGTGMNMSTLFLNMFATIGWAYDLKTASPELVKRVAKTQGDGTHKSHDFMYHI